MSKRIRTLVLSGVVMLVLIGALCAVLLTAPPEAQSGSTGTTTTTQPTLAPILDKSESDKKHTVASVTLTAGEETYTIAPNEDGLMCVTEFAALPRYADELDALLSALTKITPASLVKENATDEEIVAFGFDKPVACAEVTYLDGSTYAFEIGAIDYGEKTNSYFREAGSNTVYLVYSAFTARMTKPATHYIGRTLITAPTVRTDDKNGKAQLMKLTLDGKDYPVPVSLRYMEAADDEGLALPSPYVITAPYYRSSDEQVTGSWQTGLNSLQATGVVKVAPTAEELAKYGLDDPTTVAGITLAVFSEDKEAGTTETYDPLYYEVRVGGKDENGDYYVMVQGTDIVYTVLASYLPWVGHTYDTLTTQYFFMEYIVELSEIRITQDGAEHVLALTHGEKENGEATLDVLLDGITAKDAAKTRTLYQTLMGPKRLASAYGEQPTGDKIFSLSLVKSEGGSTDVEVYTYSSNRYLVRQADGDTYLVKASDMDLVMQSVRDYLAG